MNPVKKLASAIATVTLAGSAFAGYQAFNAEPESPVSDRVATATTEATKHQVKSKREQADATRKVTKKVVRKAAKSDQATRARSKAERKAKSAAKRQVARVAPSKSVAAETSSISSATQRIKVKRAELAAPKSTSTSNRLPYVLTEGAKSDNAAALLVLAEMSRDGVTAATDFLASIGVDPADHAR